MSNLKKWIVYLAFIITATILLVYYLFPSEFAKRYIIFRINQINPDLEVSIAHVGPTFPPGLRFDDVRFKYAGNRMLEAEKMRVVPRLTSLLRARKILHFNLNAYRGSVTGKAHIIARNKNEQFGIEAVISQVQLAEIPVIKNQSAFKLSGVLGMEISYQSEPKIGNTMRARVEILDSKLQSDNIMLKQGLMTLKRVDASLSVHDRRIELKSCKFTGDQFDGMLTGFGVLKNPVSKSTMELSIRLNPHYPILSQQDGSLLPTVLNALKSKGEDISISIRGSIDNPSFSFE